MKQFAAFALILGTLTCSRSEAASAVDATLHEIHIRSVSFSPRELTVGLGDTIVWHNVDIVRHDSVGANAFDSDELEPERSTAGYRPTPAGTGYRCTIHQRMRGQIVVTAAP